MKKIILTALIVSAFGITLYMDTHNGQLPWDDNQNTQVKYNNYQKYKKTKNIHNSRQHAKRKLNNTKRYSFSSDSKQNSYKRATLNNNYSSEVLNYRRELYKDLSQAWNYGKDINLPRTQAPAILSIEIAKNGTKYVVLRSSSGSAEFDKAALEFLNKNIGLVKPLPKNIESERFRVYVKLNKNSFGMSMAY